MIPAGFDKASPVHWLAFGLGSGFAPKAPGTVGSAAAILLYLPLAELPLAVYCVIVVLAFVTGVLICGATSRQLGVHDHGGIVWDEFVGVWITLAAVPPTPGGVLFGFLLFRLLDIVKPWPIKWADKKVHGGFGIMLDDAVAGILAAACLQAGFLLIA